jgi:prevent-host-death family protein
MSELVGIRELRQQASAVIRRVANGESITVTDRGRPVARIVPLSAGGIEQLVLEGRATRGEGDLLEMARRLGLPAPVPNSSGMTPSEALASLRADER